MHTCPQCGNAENKVVLTCRRISGSRYRRLECQFCLHRWSEHGPESLVRSSYDLRNLTDLQAARIILSEDSERTLATRYGISRASINDIRRGRSYRNVYDLLKPLIDHALQNQAVSDLD